VAYLFCLQVDVPNPNSNLSYSLAKKMATAETKLQCLFAFLGCQFVASSLELETHLERYVKHHLSLVGKFLSDEFQLNDQYSLLTKTMKQLSNFFILNWIKPIKD